MAYVIERESRSGTRYVGVYRAADGKYKSAGTYDSHERAYEIAEEEERHARGFLEETSPADKAKMTIAEFCEQRFLCYHAVSPGTRQEYGYTAKNHIIPYIGHLRISEVSRATFFNLLVEVLPAKEASQVTVRATRKVLSAMCQMAFDEGYRNNNPLRSIRLKQAPTKPVLVASYDQWRRLEEALTYPPARLYARLNVTSWARRCEMIGFRPCDFEFGQQMLNVTRSTVYVNAAYHPSGRRGGSPSRIRRTATGVGSLSPSRCASRYRNTSSSTTSDRKTSFSRSGCSPTCDPALFLLLTTRIFLRWCPSPVSSMSTGRKVPHIR